MSYHEYKTAQQIVAQDYPFYALIQAAIRQADTQNLSKLRTAFPNVYDELITRYNAPGGWLKGEHPDDVVTAQVLGGTDDD